METLTAALAHAHGIWRFVVFIFGGLAIGKCLIGWAESREWKAIDQSLITYFITAVDIGVLLGLLVWLLQGRWDGEDLLRSWRHPALMLLALAIVHVGWVQAKAASDSKGRFARCSVFFSSASAVILLGILQIQGVF